MTVSDLTEEEVIAALRNAEAEVSITGDGWRSDFRVLPIRAGWQHFSIRVFGVDLDRANYGLAVLRALFMDGREHHVRTDDGAEKAVDFVTAKVSYGGYLRFSVNTVRA